MCVGWLVLGLVCGEMWWAVGYGRWWAIQLLGKWVGALAFASVAGAATLSVFGHDHAPLEDAVLIRFPLEPLLHVCLVLCLCSSSGKVGFVKVWRRRNSRNRTQRTRLCRRRRRLGPWLSLLLSPSQSHLLAQNRCTPKKNKGMMEERARERGKKTLTTKCRPKDNVGVLGWCSTSCRVGGGWKGYGRGVEVGGEGWGEVKGGWSGREGGWKRMENFSTVSQR